MSTKESPAATAGSPSARRSSPGRGFDKGLYVLLIEAHGRVRVGRLGEFDFNGKYLYVGSARGPGGFRRVGRHLAIASGEDRPKRWHIDYLLASGRLLHIWLLPDANLTECELVQELIARGAQPAAPGFGAGDSPCETHLLWADNLFISIPELGRRCRADSASP